MKKKKAKPAHKIHSDHSHEHGRGCGHKAVKHGNHTDYKHGSHYHRKHKGHWDECKGPKAA